MECEAVLQKFTRSRTESWQLLVLSSTQNIVAVSQEAECELKYVMFTQSRKSTELFVRSECSALLTFNMHPANK